MIHFILLLCTAVALINCDCVSSPTTVSGKYAPTGQICSGQLIFSEDFDEFDTDLWQHEITMSGGGVSI